MKGPRFGAALRLLLCNPYFVFFCFSSSAGSVKRSEVSCSTVPLGLLRRPLPYRLFIVHPQTCVVICVDRTKLRQTIPNDLSPKLLKNRRQQTSTNVAKRRIHFQSLMSYRLNDLPAEGGHKRAARTGNFPTRACGAARHEPDGLCG